MVSTVIYYENDIKITTLRLFSLLLPIWHKQNVKSRKSTCSIEYKCSFHILHQFNLHSKILFSFCALKKRELKLVEKYMLYFLNGNIVHFDELNQFFRAVRNKTFAALNNWIRSVISHKHLNYCFRFCFKHDRICIHSQFIYLFIRRWTSADIGKQKKMQLQDFSSNIKIETKGMKNQRMTRKRNQIHPFLSTTTTKTHIHPNSYKH